MSGRGAGEPPRTLARLRAIPYGAHVPARPRDHVTTEELLAITRSTRDTLYEWVALKLLPRPWLTTGTDETDQQEHDQHHGVVSRGRPRKKSLGSKSDSGGRDSD